MSCVTESNHQNHSPQLATEILDETFSLEEQGKSKSKPTPYFSTCV